MISAAGLERATGVLLVGPTPPPHGGVAVHVAALARHLRADGTPVELLDPHRLRQGEGVGARTGAAARLALRVHRGAGHGRATHLHVNGHNDSSWALAALTGLAATAAPWRALTVHSGLAPEYLAAAGSLRRRLVRAAARRYDELIAVSEPVADGLRAIALPVERIRIQPAWVGVERSGQPLPPPIGRWLSAHRPLLAATMAFRPEYRFDWLLRALEATRASHPTAGLVVMGGGDGVEGAAHTVREQGLDGAVLLCGDVPHEICTEIVARCDVLLRPTLADGDALSVREALAFGVPVVASDVGHRPAGARLFAVDDPDAMLATLREVLDQAVGVSGGIAAAGHRQREAS